MMSGISLHFLSFYIANFCAINGTSLKNKESVCMLIVSQYNPGRPVLTHLSTDTEQVVTNGVDLGPQEKIGMSA